MMLRGMVMLMMLMMMMMIMMMMVMMLPVADQDTLFIKLSKKFWWDVVGDVERDGHLHPSPVHSVHLVLHPQNLPTSRGGMPRPVSAWDL